jgi:hypothetical protein
MFHQTLCDNILISHALKQVLSALEKEDIRPIVLSGAALIELVYPDLGSRQMADVDLLVQPKDLAGLDNALRFLGYQPRLTPHPEEIHYHPANPGIPPVEMDIQTEVWHLNERQLAEVWHKAREVRLNGTPALVLSPEDMFIYSVADTSVFHGFLELRWLNDIRYIVERYNKELNWSKIVSLIKQMRLKIPVYYVLQRAIQNAQAQIPQTVMATLKPCPSDYLQARFWQTVLDSPRHNLISAFIRFWTIRAGRSRLIFLKNYLFPRRQFFIDRYKLKGREWLYPLFYIIRPLDHFVKVLYVSLKIFRACFKPFYKSLERHN